MSLFFSLCVPALSHPAAAAHLHRGMGELALVGGLQRGQCGDSAEDNSVQRTHGLAHHQGGAAQWCPETGTVLSLLFCLGRSRPVVRAI